MIVLQEAHVAQPEAVVVPSAVAYRHLICQSVPRQRLARVEDMRPGALAELDELCCRRGDAAHALEEIEHRPLRAEEGAVGAADADQVLSLGDVVSVGDERLIVHLLVDVGYRLYQSAGHLDAGDDAVRRGGDEGGLELLPRDDREGGEVVRDPILVEGEVNETI